MEPNDVLAGLDTLPVVDEEVIAPLHDPDLGGDADFLAEVVQAFRDDAPPRLVALRDACHSRDADATVRAAHSLKGSSSNFGAARVQALCAEIERLGQDGTPEAATPLIAPLETEYARLVERLDAIIASATATG